MASRRQAESAPRDVFDRDFRNQLLDGLPGSCVFGLGGCRETAGILCDG